MSNEELAKMILNIQGVQLEMSQRLNRIENDLKKHDHCLHVEYQMLQEKLDRIAEGTAKLTVGVHNRLDRLEKMIKDAETLTARDWLEQYGQTP